MKNFYHLHFSILIFLAACSEEQNQEPSVGSFDPVVLHTELEQTLSDHGFEVKIVNDTVVVKNVTNHKALVDVVNQFYASKGIDGKFEIGGFQLVNGRALNCPYCTPGPIYDCGGGCFCQDFHCWDCQNNYYFHTSKICP